jgi:hypothetical protein
MSTGEAETAMNVPNKLVRLQEAIQKMEQGQRATGQRREAGATQSKNQRLAWLDRKVAAIELEYDWPPLKAIRRLVEREVLDD